MGVAQHHRDGLPSAERHERREVSVGGIVPRCPRVAAVVRVEIGYSGPPAGSIERPLDLPPTVVFGRVGPLVGPAKDDPRAMRHICRRRGRGDEAVFPAFSVLRVEKRSMGAGQVDVAPVERQRLPMRQPVNSMKVTSGARCGAQQAISLSASSKVIHRTRPRGCFGRSNAGLSQSFRLAACIMIALTGVNTLRLWSRGAVGNRRRAQASPPLVLSGKAELP